MTRAEIVALVAERHGLTIAEMKSHHRGRKAAWARQEAMALMYSLGRWSRGQIGVAVNRTSWTVEFGVRRHKERVAAAAHKDAGKCGKRTSGPSLSAETRAELSA